MIISIDTTTLDQVHEFINSGELVELMNQKGLSVDSMCFVLQAILTALDDAAQQLDGEENM